MLQVKVLYVRNLKSDVTEDQLRERFEQFGKVERVKKVKDYGFVHFDEREHALKALDELNGQVCALRNCSPQDMFDIFYKLAEVPTLWQRFCHGWSQLCVKSVLDCSR